MLTLPEGMQEKIDSRFQTIHGNKQPEMQVLLYGPPGETPPPEPGVFGSYPMDVSYVYGICAREAYVFIYCKTDDLGRTMMIYNVAANTWITMAVEEPEGTIGGGVCGISPTSFYYQAVKAASYDPGKIYYYNGSTHTVIHSGLDDVWCTSIKLCGSDIAYPGGSSGEVLYRGSSPWNTFYPGTYTAWNNTTPYAIGDKVLYNALHYTCLEPNTGVTPDHYYIWRLSQENISGLSGRSTDNFWVRLMGSTPTDIAVFYQWNGSSWIDRTGDPAITWNGWSHAVNISATDTGSCYQVKIDTDVTNDLYRYSPSLDGWYSIEMPIFESHAVYPVAVEALSDDEVYVMGIFFVSGRNYYQLYRYSHPDEWELLWTDPDGKMGISGYTSILSGTSESNLWFYSGGRFFCAAPIAEPEPVIYSDWHWVEDDSATLGSSKTWTDITSAGKKYVWACNDVGQIYRHNGRGWSLEHNMGSQWGLTAIHASSSTVVWCCGWRDHDENDDPIPLEHVVMRRDSAGDWVVSHHAQGQKLIWIWGGTATDMWAFGEYGLRLRYTEPSGVGSWALERADDDQAYAQYEIVRAVGHGANYIWAVGHGGRVFYFNGIEWNDDATYFVNAGIDLHNVSVLSSGIIQASGNTSGGTEELLQSTDTGVTWPELDLGDAAGTVRGVVALGESLFFVAVGDTTWRKQYENSDVTEVEVVSENTPVPSQILNLSANSGWLVGYAEDASGIWHLAPPEEVATDISKYLESGDMRMDVESPIRTCNLTLNNPDKILAGETTRLVVAGYRVELAFRIGTTTTWVKLGSYGIDNIKMALGDPMVTLSGRGEIMKRLYDQNLEEDRMHDEAMTSGELIGLIVSDCGLDSERVFIYSSEIVPTVDPVFTRSQSAFEAIQSIMLNRSWWRMQEDYDRNLWIGPPAGEGYIGWVYDIGSEPFLPVGTYSFARGVDLFSRAIETDDASVYRRICVEGGALSVDDELLGYGNGSQDVYQADRFPILEESETITVDGKQQVRLIDYNIDYATGKVTFTPGHIPPNTSTLSNRHECHGYTITVPDAPDANNIGYGCPRVWKLWGMAGTGVWTLLDDRSHNGWLGESDPFTPPVIVADGCRAYKLAISLTWFYQQDEIPDAYSAASSYTKGEKVTYGTSYIYECIRTTPAFYDGNTTYSPHDLVSYAATDLFYECIVGHAGGHPPTDGAYWLSHGFRTPGNPTYWQYLGPPGKYVTRPNIEAISLLDEEANDFAPMDMTGPTKAVIVNENEPNEETYYITASANSEFSWGPGDTRPAWYAFDGEDTRWIPNEYNAGWIQIDFGELIVEGEDEVRISYETIQHSYVEVPPSEFVSVPPLKTLYIPVPSDLDEDRVTEIATEAAELITNAGKIETFVGPIRPQVITGDNATITPGGAMGLVTTLVHRFGKPGFSTELTVDSGRRIGKPTIQELLDRSINKIIRAQ